MIRVKEEDVEFYKKHISYDAAIKFIVTLGNDIPVLSQIGYKEDRVNEYLHSLLQYIKEKERDSIILYEMQQTLKTVLGM